MRPIPRLFLPFLLPLVASAAPLTIDLTTPVPPPTLPPYGPGTSTSPDGHTITADSYSLLLDGKRWTPVAGEFHYSRYPRDEWRDELLKMKAGGINVVSTYVFWIHQEEEQGKFDWSGQRSLRDFLLLCQQVGLKAFVRLGPWCHGEVRNGGIPDWVEYSGAKLRSTDPAFLNLVKPLYTEEAKQMQGLLWKDGGPVIGIQVDNENGNAPYLRALKQMARDAGIDVPYYAMTGWDIKVLDKDLLPLFGAYFDGFWGGTPEKYRRDFMFTGVRASNNLGAQMNDRAQQNSDNIAKFPYLCVEIGPGMMSSYAKRIKVDPDAVTTMALVKMGEGSNMPGYYMYQGGMNPDGKLSTLEETHPNFMPLKDYDFQTCLGACGQVREQFHLLLEQHLFLQDFGSKLAAMPAFFPDVKPAGVDDSGTLRWDVRSDGTSGYIFFTNKQPYVPLPEHKDVQFQLKTTGGPVTIPRAPMTIPSGAYGFFPFNMDCDGVTIEYATVQPLCRIDDGHGSVAYFFTGVNGTSTPGIVPELALKTNGGQVRWIVGAMQANAHTGPAAGAKVIYPPTDFRAISATSNLMIRIQKKNGGSVLFVVLTPYQSLLLSRAYFAGQDRLIISSSTVLSDSGGLRLLSDHVTNFGFLIYPPLLKINGFTPPRNPAHRYGFASFQAPPLKQPEHLVITASQLQASGTSVPTLSGTDEASWNSAAIYKLNIPKAASTRRVILNIHYIGDMARLYIGDKLYDDNFFNGDPFAIALWRIPADQWANLRLKVLPATDALLPRLPDQAKNEVATAHAAGTTDQVTVTAADQLELKISPN